MSTPFPTALHHPREWGAEPLADGTWRFGLWSPQTGSATVIVDGRETAMQRGESGWWHARAAGRDGDPYLFDLDGRQMPDFAARAQIGPVDGASRLIDPRAYRWTSPWAGRPWHEAVIYELHVGTFTPEGTFAAAAREVPRLAGLGITAIELMPVAQFPGNRGWGYDGVLPFAPHPAYGSPDDLRALVETAQRHGVSVMLDVVMNHFGPDGACIHAIAPDFFDQQRHTPWGAAIDFTQPAVRQFFIDTCLGWLTEYRLDGLRLDAVHQIIDTSEPHFMTALGQAVAAGDFGREIYLVCEDERNISDLRDSGLYKAEWNDDYHHAVHCALTGESESYYASFAVDPFGDLVVALRDGHVEQGQPRHGLEAPRGQPSGHLPWTCFVNANQTHDQVGNRALGDRLLSLADPDAVRVAHALLLLSPFVPMLFMGEEVGETAPFLFFCDYSGDLARATRDGRRREFAAFVSHAGEVPDPNAPETFEASRPFRGDPETMADWQGLTRDLLDLRARHVMPLLASGRRGRPDVQRIGDRALVARWPFADGTLAIRLNLGQVGPHDPGDGSALFTLGDLSRDAHAIDMKVFSA